MATRGVTLWSTTAATNNTADPAVNWAEGMTPGSVNDSARGMMAGIAGYRNDGQGITTAGTSTAFTVATYATFASASAMGGYVFTIIPHTDSGAAPTLAVDGLTARAINYSTGVAIPTGALKSGTPYAIKYVHASTEFILLGGLAVLPTNLVTTAAITDKSVTYAKIQDITASRLVGRASTSAGVMEEITLGTGLVVNSTTLSAPAFPPPGSFKNLVIKVASNTTVTVTADFVTTTDGTQYQSTAVSSTVNLGTNGGLDALEGSLSIAIDTWYYLWVIAKADGTTKVLANTSTSAVTFPTGYTYKARVGAVQTINGSATLYGTWQYGRKAQYVVGLAQTSQLPSIAGGSTGTTTDPPTWISKSLTRFVPTTASEIFIQQYWNANTLIAAPSTGYGGHGSTNKPPPIDNTTGPASVIAHMLLEATTVQYASSGNSNGLFCMGWVDNI